MNEKTKEQKQVPKCPPQDELPPSEIIWQGRARHLGDYRPCRVVLRYVWSLYAKAEKWETTAEYVFERANENDAMGNPRYETQPKTDIPDVFFGDVCDAFRIAGPPLEGSGNA